MFSKALKLAVLFIFGLGFICPDHAAAQNVIRILPLGNSITVGYTNGTLPVSELISYRFGLHTQLTNAGYSIDFVGSESHGSDFFTDTQHGGINGFQDQHLVRLLTDGYDLKRSIQIINPAGPYLDYYNPDVILLHLGTNDVTYETNPGTTQIVNILNLIDAYELRANKTVVVFLGLIINRKIGVLKRTETSNYNNQLKAMAQTRINNGDRIVIVDMENDAGFIYRTAPTANADLTDDIHPNTLGYNKMANLWFSSIDTGYNHKPKIAPAIPDQVKAEGQSFDVINLDEYVSDKEDSDGDLVWTYLPSDPENLVVSINAARQVTVTPKNVNWFGSDTVIFKVTDLGIEGKAVKYTTDTVAFAFTPVNDPPVITSIPFTKSKEDSLYYYVVNATDAEGQPLTYSAVSIPDWLAFNSSFHILSGTPRNEHVGSHLVELSVTDGELITNQIFEIVVENVNDVPTIVGMAKQVKTVKNTPVEIKLTDLLVNDPDNQFPDDFILELEPGDNYTLSGNLIVPATDFIGTLKVSTRVNDGIISSGKSNVNVEVTLQSGTGDIPGNAQEEIYLFPNPAHDRIFINNEDIEDFSLMIYNNLGIVLFNQKYNNISDTMSIDLSQQDILPGMYYYRIISDNKEIIGKILIQ